MNQKIPRQKFITLVVLFLFFLNFHLTPTIASEYEIRDIYFPTNPSFGFVDSFGDGRYEHEHEGTDIMGEQMAPLYSAVDGVVSYITIPEASWGYHLVIRDSDNYAYHYLHINNDTPGTDDGKGGVENAYAPGIARGSKVSKGQLVGYMGDSGNAEEVGNHLHFEIHRPDDIVINSYPSLTAALNKKPANPLDTLESSVDINDDKSLVVSRDRKCDSGSLIKLIDSSAVYYCGADSKRYVFPNEKIFYSWYDNFDKAVVLPADKMEAIPLGGNVTYRPGKRMIKLQSSSKVYMVEKGGVLRWVQSAETASYYYGPEWNKYIDDIFESFFMDYKPGTPLG